MANKVFLLGRLTKDIEPNQTGKMATTTIAVDRGMKDQNGEKVTDFVLLKFLGEKKVENASKYLHKGSKIMIEGSLWIDNYKDVNGNNKSISYVNVNNYEFCEARSSQAAESKPQTDSDGFVSVPDGIDEMLPFN